mgnify:FL=1
MNYIEKLKKKEVAVSVCAGTATFFIVFFLPNERAIFRIAPLIATVLLTTTADAAIEVDPNAATAEIGLLCRMEALNVTLLPVSKV